jgi:hypothetical protein
MPANVGSASPATVFPAMRWLSLQAVSDWSTSVNEYPDGSAQRRSLPGGSPAKARLRFIGRARLGATAMLALKAFYVARVGKQGPFWFYYGVETVPKWGHDPTGTETDGRYCVRFANDFTMQFGLARGEVEVELVEIT